MSISGLSAANLSTALAAKLDGSGVGSSIVDANEATTSSSFTDLATAGPSVTLTTGTKALIIITAQISASTADYAYAGFAVSGASTIAASTSKSLLMGNPSATSQPVIIAAWSILETGLTAGINTFTVKYRADGGGTATFRYRNLTVIDMGS